MHPARCSVLIEPFLFDLIELLAQRASCTLQRYRVLMMKWCSRAAVTGLHSYFLESSTWPSPSWSFKVKLHGKTSIRRSCASSMMLQ